jgi:hypothetical protein
MKLRKLIWIALLGVAAGLMLTGIYLGSLWLYFHPQVQRIDAIAYSQQNGRSLAMDVLRPAWRVRGQTHPEGISMNSSALQISLLVISHISNQVPLNQTDNESLGRENDGSQPDREPRQGRNVYRDAPPQEQPAPAGRNVLSLYTLIAPRWGWPDLLAQRRYKHYPPPGARSRRGKMGG